MTSQPRFRFLRKPRGQRRHYRWLQRWSASFSVRLGPEHWYDLWHLHPDHMGWGNRSGRARRQHFLALVRAIERVLHQTTSYQHPFQTFLSISGRDSSLDAIYFHTPNPNADNFPHRFEGFDWDYPTTPSWASSGWSTQRFEFGSGVFASETWFVLVPRGRGGRI